MQSKPLIRSSLFCIVASTLAVFEQPTAAQVAPDDTLGAERSVIDFVDSEDSSSNSFYSGQIGGGAIRGANLFHSFRDFNVAVGESLYFQNPPGVENIISRVTGTGSSYIEGTIGVLNGTGDVFLLNPNGIVFGADARLDVGGSFIATTATAIQFENQLSFSSAVPDVSPLLSVRPSAFLFGQTSPGEIINRSTVPLAPDPLAPDRLASDRRGLQVPDGESLFLLGGNIYLTEGGINTSGGRVELGAVADSGTVELGIDNNNFRLSYPDALNRADISLTDGAAVVTSGERAGEIQIWGRNVFINSDAYITSTTEGTKPGGQLSINASELLELRGHVPGGNISTISFGTGRAGDLAIEAQRLRMLEGVQVFSVTAGKGAAGEISVNATDSIEVGEQIFTPSPRLSGLASFTSAAGLAGNLTVNASRLIVRDGGFLSTEAASGPEDDTVSGMGGNLTINASDSVTLRRQGFIFASTQGSGNSGEITINTGRLFVEDESAISTASLNSGNAGNITVNAQSVVLSNQSLIEAMTEESQGGDVTLQVSDFLLLRQDSAIATTAGTAQAGGDGGDIRLDLANGFVIAVPAENSDIRANAFEGTGGNVNIAARSVLGTAFRPDVLDTPRSDITASSQFGSSGTVVINELNPETLQTEIKLPADTAPPPLAQGCRTASSPTGSFITTGRGGLPTNPTDPLSADSLWQDIAPIESDASELASRELAGSESASHEPASSKLASSASIQASEASLIEAQGWRRDRNGDVTLIAQSTAAPERFAAALGCTNRASITENHQQSTAS